MIRVLLVDDQNVIRQGLQALLSTETDIEVVALGKNGEEAIELVATHHPDIVLMDVFMPVMDGVTAASIICQDYPSVKVLLLSGSEDDSRTVKAISVGAKGYLLKSASGSELANSIRAVHKGYTQLAPGILEKLVAQSKKTVPPTPAVETSPPPHRAIVTFQRLLASPFPVPLDELETLIAQVDQAHIAQTLNTQMQQLPQTQGYRWDLAYLAGKLQARILRQPSQALVLLQSGFQQAQAEKADLKILLRFCQAMGSVQPQASYSALKELFANQVQRSSSAGFLQAVADVFGQDSAEHRWVGVLWQMHAIHLLSEQCQSLKSKLDDINQKMALSLDLKKRLDSEETSP